MKIVGCDLHTRYPQVAMPGGPHLGLSLLGTITNLRVACPTPPEGRVGQQAAECGVAPSCFCSSPPTLILRVEQTLKSDSAQRRRA